MRRMTTLAALVGLVAAACGTPTTTTTTPPSTQPAAPQQTTTTPPPSTSPQESEAPGSVVFFGYEDSFLPDVLQPFEARTGIQVETPAFADEDETEAKLRAGFQADVVELCSGEAGSMIEAGLLQPIDTSRIEAWDQIFSSFKEGEDVIDDQGNVWIVPLQGGPFGIVYLADEVEPITSYQQLFFGDYEGDIAVSEEPVSTIWDMAMALGYGPQVDDITDDQVVEAVDALIATDRIRTTWSEDGDLIQLLATGEVVAAAHATPDIAEALQEEGINAVYVAPSEGQILWKCGHGISANAKNLDAAYALINHYLDPEMQLVFAEEYGYMASNSAILDVAPPELVEELRLDDPGAIDQVTIPEGLPENEEFWDDQWQRFAG